MQLDPQAPAIAVLGDYVHQPWQAHVDGVAHLCREVRRAEDGSVAFFDSLARAHVRAGSSITYRLPVDLRPLPPATDPTPSHPELCVDGLSVASDPRSGLVVVFVGDA